ncbi:hypothetical protein RJ639_017185 [Escallonia herrerae]|uniref:Uncharacterized protein n=1 Tax=Escallonia herrerae TaxID=1293975 RepID=A0AA89AMS9_9ASTE|nr:hypothetical protein RJ639_017185 [Escallonia herrerae]
MPNVAFMSVLLLTCFCSNYQSLAKEVESSVPRNAGLETYIVHVKSPNGPLLSEPEDLESWYRSFMPTNIASPSERSRLVYSYRNVVTGFAARLSPEEAKAMEKKDGFVFARPQRVYALHTTHSPSFLGLQQTMGVWGDSNYGKGVIIGVLDTGVTPGHPSFSDLGVPPPPAKWKGRCLLNGTACNNKLIGARSFLNGEITPLPIDEEGHGTHTSSTAAGNMVKDANVFGNANGTAAGMAPLAHLAIYKVCSVEDCTETDILAAMDAAVEDGVDVLSLSLGIGSAAFFQDSIAIGAFGAMEKGIFVSCSAGNSGPFNASLSNEAPWILTVGASTIDRSIKATAMLGNKLQLEGESLFQPKSFPSTLMPLVYPTGVNEDLNISNSLCGIGSFKDIDVKGKVVLCERGGGIGRIDKGQTVKDAGGAAMIMMSDVDNGESTIAATQSIPEAQLNYPSFSISLMASTVTTFTRTVTNVGEPNSSYDLEVSPPPGVAVTVKPNRLVFSKANQQMTYQVTFSRLAPDVNSPYVQGSLKWYSSKRFVRSPISVKLT